MEKTPSLTTRLLHAGLVIGISLQLLLSTFMEMPGTKVVRNGLSAIGFELHEVFGMLSLSLILAWFVWLFVRRTEEGSGELFPWFSSTSRHALLQAVKSTWVSLRSRCSPSPADNNRIARTVHGLGALCALGMALTGFTVWLGMSDSGQLADWARLVLTLHRSLATLMWVYVLGHAGMALLHHARGETTMGRMFTFGRPNRQPVERVH
ncbi:MAG: cytochrome b/b6 domain-containing protein [Candidatus Thiodiazotropha sp.]